MQKGVGRGRVARAQGWDGREEVDKRVDGGCSFKSVHGGCGLGGRRS